MRIVEAHLHLKDAALGVGGGRDARDKALVLAAMAALHHHLLHGAELEALHHGVGHAKDGPHGGDVGQGKRRGPWRHQRAHLQVARQHHAIQRRPQHRIVEGGARLLHPHAAAGDAGRGAAEAGPGDVEVGLRHAVAGGQPAGAVEVDLCLLTAGHRLGQGGVGLGELLAVVRAAHARQHGAAADAVALLQQAQVAVHPGELGDLLHVAADAKGHVDRGGRVDARGVARRRPGAAVAHPAAPAPPVGTFTCGGSRRQPAASKPSGSSRQRAPSQPRCALLRLMAGGHCRSRS